ncbi:hypothetical protein BFX40_20435 [Mesorhizobium sp. SEMIA 3007]|nr:hypothetical protein BFX40_20435 [Mesorhizobium sp. SEMIA 3007]
MVKNRAELVAARIAGVLAVLVFFAWISRGESHIKDGEWHFYAPSDPVVVSDGTEVAGSPIMSRWNGSAWEYRHMTQHEEIAFNDLIGGPPMPTPSRP